MIQTVLALSQFFIENFPNISWYPYWYLGNPYHFLIGPVVPIFVLSIKYFVLSSFLIQGIYLGMIFTAWVVGGVGVYKLVRECRGKREEGITSALFFLLFPFAALLLASGANGLYHFAWGFLPWVFVIFLRFLDEPYQASLRGPANWRGRSNLLMRLPRPFGARNDGMKKETKIALLLSILIAFVLLIDVSILLPLLVGFFCLGVVWRIGPIGQIRQIEYQILKTCLVLFLAISIATIWYTPGFWLTLLQNPSFGGVPLANLGKFLFQLLLNLIPILAAVWVVKLRAKKISQVTYFGLLFLLSFLFLTIIRYLSDPDFVRDWIGFLIEIQFGMAIVLGHFTSLRGPANWRGRSNLLMRLPRPFGARNDGVFVFLILLSILVSVWIGKNWMNSTNSDYQQRILGMLKNVPQGERVFLSGTPVFWANSYLDIAQVRGGVDQASIHPFWADGAYQIREGEDSMLALNWLKAMGASWILVHGQDSQEPYRDFKHLEKFTQLSAVSRQSSDILYKVGGISVARVADESILQVKKPKNGADVQTLAKYVNTLKTPLSLASPPLAKLEVNADLKEGEVISLAETYDRGWKVVGPPEAGDIKIIKDGLGNMVIEPQKPGRIHLSLAYKMSLWERVVPVLISLMLVFMLINYDKLYPKMSGMLAKLGHGLGEE